jgi:hypothetical protein
MDIPDFTKKEDREKYADDDLNPFPSTEREATLPARFYRVDNASGK